MVLTQASQTALQPDKPLLRHMTLCLGPGQQPPGVAPPAPQRKRPAGSLQLRAVQDTACPRRRKAPARRPAQQGTAVTELNTSPYNVATPQICCT